jgi:hypothetical protein
MGIHPKMAILIMGCSGYVNPYQWTHLSPKRTLGANLLGALVEDNLIARFAPMATCRDPSQRATGQPKNDPEKMATSGEHKYIYIYTHTDAFPHRDFYTKTL